MNRIFDACEMLALTRDLRDELAAPAASTNSNATDTITLAWTAASFYSAIDWATPTVEHYVSHNLVEPSWLKAWYELRTICADASEASIETDTAYEHALHVVARTASMYSVLDAMVSYWEDRVNALDVAA